MSVNTLIATFVCDDGTDVGDLRKALATLAKAHHVLRHQTTVFGGQPGTIEDWIKVHSTPTPEYLQEFPDYDDAIHLPRGWVDHSWHNDACPSFFHPGKRAVIFLDYKDSARREYQGAVRFSAHSAGEEGERTDEWELEGDDLHELLVKIEYQLPA